MRPPAKLAGAGVAAVITANLVTAPPVTPSLDDLRGFEAATSTPIVIKQESPESIVSATPRDSVLVSKLEGLIKASEGNKTIKTKIVTKYHKITGKTALPTFHRKAINDVIATAAPSVQSLLGGQLVERDDFQDALDVFQISIAAVNKLNTELVRLEALNARLTKVAGELKSGGYVSELDLFLIKQGIKL